MKNGKSDADIKRRGFLLAGSVGAAAAVAAAVAPSVQKSAAVIVTAPKNDDAGYRDSEHVRTYYDLARI